MTIDERIAAMVRRLERVSDTMRRNDQRFEDRIRRTRKEITRLGRMISSGGVK